MFSDDFTSARVLMLRADAFENEQEYEMYKKGLISWETFVRNRKMREERSKLGPALKSLVGWIVWPVYLLALAAFGCFSACVYKSKK